MRLAALAVLMVFGAAMAQETEKKIELKIMVADDASGEDPDVHWVSDADFELDDLAIGETRTLTGESGREVTVTRTDEGMQFNVDGETVVMPDLGQHGAHMAFVNAGGEHEDVDVRVIGDGAHVMRAHHPEGITIVSGEPLDDSVRESIRSVLISAGHEDEVVFIDGSGDGKHVKIIKKRVATIK